MRHRERYRATLVTTARLRPAVVVFTSIKKAPMGLDDVCLDARLPNHPDYQSGAGEESRTLDLNLGKVALYQLSYSRVSSLKV